MTASPADARSVRKRPAPEPADFRSAFPEERCLALMLEARRGATRLSCQACGREARFLPRPKLRALACEHCNFLLYPCVGTPLEARRIPLSTWFQLQQLREAGGATPRRIAKALRIPETQAGRMLAELEAAARDKDSHWLVALGRALNPGGEERPHPPAEAAGAGPVDGASPPAGPSPSRALWLGLGAAGFLVLLGLAALLAWLTAAPTPLLRQDAETPVLQAAAQRPSLILSSVEGDLEAARQATRYAIAADPSLARIEEQPASPLMPQPAPQLTPPPDILLVPPRLPPIARPPPQQQAGVPQPPAVAGNPDEVLTFGPIRIRRHLVDMIVRAGKVVGADPTLLMAIADKESSFSTAVQAKTSSATGLYQFIEQTWLGVVAEFGARHGLGAEAQMVQRNGRQFGIADPAQRQRILDLRREPYLSALLAGEMLKRDTLRLEKRLGRHLSGGEIYLIHFLGPDAAQTFIATLDESPGADASELLPRPAQANRPIFYGQAGGEQKALSVAEIHKKFDDMIKLRLDRYGTVRQIGAGVVQPAAQRR